MIYFVDRRRYQKLFEKHCKENNRETNLVTAIDWLIYTNTGKELLTKLQEWKKEIESKQIK